MKNWKKWLAMLLAVAMLMSLLAACGGESESEDEEDEEETEEADEKDETKDDKDETKGDDKDETKPSGNATEPQPTQPQATQPQPTEPQPTEPEQTTPVTPPTTNTADFFDVAATMDELDAYEELQIQFDEGDGYTTTVAVKNLGDDKGLLYLNQYYSADNWFESVIEIDGESYKGYYRYNYDESFRELDADGAALKVELIYSYFEVVSVDNGAYGTLGEEYVLVGEENAASGSVYVFNECFGENVNAEIYVDQATGIIVKYEYLGEDGFALWEVIAINTSDAGIPAYK